MKMTVIPLVIGTVGTIPKGLIQGLEDLKIRGQVETIQTTALLRLSRILRRVLEICCHSNSNGKPSANTSVKNYLSLLLLLLLQQHFFKSTSVTNLTRGKNAVFREWELYDIQF